MAIVKVAEATGKVLDWLVAKCEGFDVKLYEKKRVAIVNKHRDTLVREWSPSTNWAQGGPILDRESIDVMKVGTRQWRADCGPARHGPTPLIAVMRCYVTKKLGDVAEVPDALLK